MSAAHFPRWIPPLMIVLVVVYLNYWMWNDARVLLGLPANLLYHVIFSLLLYPVMRFVVDRGWPRYLDED